MDGKLVVDIFQVVTGIATGLSVIVLIITTILNDTRNRKEMTIQYTITHGADKESFQYKLKEYETNGRIDVDKVKRDGDMLFEVESYLFAMERLAVGINMKVYDIKILDKVMGQKAIDQFEILEPYIIEARSKDYVAIYTEYEKMVGNLRKIRKKRFQK